MKKAKKRFARFMSALMVITFLAASLNVSVFAMPEAAEADSRFVLSNPGSCINADYFPEKIYEEEKAEHAFNILREKYSSDVNFVKSAPMSRANNSITELGDPWVFRTQRWLNENYGNVSGFGFVTENGKTGWDTIYGLTRALQVELQRESGESFTLANSFGATTSRLYSKNILKPGAKNNKVALLTGALLCKGYNPGMPAIPYYADDGSVVFDAVFDSGIESAVKSLKTDAGFLNPNGDVTLNVMKALMSMDSFVLLSAYGGKAEIRKMQQQFNRKYEAYLGGLIPCDGVYGRGTNTALIKALQAAEGLPPTNPGDGVYANGNFGPTTRRLIPQIPYVKNAEAAKPYKSDDYYTDAQISVFVELVQFALYLNGFGDGSFDGSFGADTQKDLHDFQVHYALPVTEKVDLDTWMSLFLSSGNTDRPAVAADCAQILTPATVKTLYDNGYRYIGRYLTGTYSSAGQSLSKALTVQEAEYILEGGLSFFPIYQAGQYSASADPELAKTYFTAEKGISDASAAIEAAAALGLPDDTVIYFAVDFDALDVHVTSNIIPYFQKVYETVSAQSNYRVGIYGTRNVCSRVAAKGYSVSSFVAGMSTGWSGNLGFKIPDDWAFSQIKEYTIGEGEGRLGIDKNAFSGRDQGVKELNNICADGHEYVCEVTTVPTAEAEGTLTVCCKNCGETETITLPKLSIEEYTCTVTEAATCTENGSTSYTWKNTAYGTYSFDVVTGATGHHYENGVCVDCSAVDPEYKKIVIMKKEQIKAYVDGQVLPMTDYGNGNFAMAKSMNGTYALPLRCIGEAFDMRVDYLGSGRTKLTNKAGDYVVVTRDSNILEKYDVNNNLINSFTADFATFTEASITYVPMRAVSEALGLGVSYVGSGTTGHGSYVAVSTDLFLNLKPEYVLEEIEKAYALGL